MRKYLIYISFFLFTFTCYAQNKKALFFCVGNYAPKSGWRNLGSLNDYEFMEQILLNQGFLKSDIKLVADSFATRKGMETALDAFISGLKTGDIVFLQFSGHGIQIADDNNDEVDGLDEALVCYDALNPSVHEILSDSAFLVMSKAFFRDDLLGDYIQKIREKISATGDLLILIDACHSGTISRGFEHAETSARGSATALTPPFWQRSGRSSDRQFGVLNGNLDAANLAPYVLITAAMANQLDQEVEIVRNRKIGGLTFGVLKAFEMLTENCTYRTLFAYSKSAITKVIDNQIPTLEGTGIDKQIFGGQFVSAPSFAEVVEIDEVKRQVVINRGTLSGIQPPSVISFFKAGTSDFSSAAKIMSGSVVESTLLSSTVVLHHMVRGSPADYWAIADRLNFSVEPLTFNFAAINNSNGLVEGSRINGTLKNNILDTLGLLGIHFSKERPIVSLNKMNDSIAIYVSESGRFLKKVSFSELGSSLLKYNKYRFLRNLTIPSSDLMVSLNLVRLNKGSALTKPSDVGGNLVVKNLIDTVEIVLSNRSSETIYYNVVDLSPDGEYNVLFKKADNFTAEELRLGPNISKSLVKFTIKTEFDGIEILKLFVSKSEIDLESIIHGNANSRGLEVESLETMFGNKSAEILRGNHTNSKIELISDILFEVVTN